MMAGNNQAALAVCAETKVIFPFKCEVIPVVACGAGAWYQTTELDALNRMNSSFPDRLSFSYLNLTKICHSHNS